jgi:phosphoglycolate phosphatase
MSGKFDLIVFDWDGTLFDSVGRIVQSLQQAAAECGMPPPGDLAARAVIGLGLSEAMETLFPGSLPQQRENLVGCYRNHYLNGPGPALSLFKGVRDMLQALNRHGYRLAVATGKARAGLDRALRATATEEFFLTTRCADESASKPNPTMLFEIMASLGACPAKTLMVGDTLHDLRMARNAGIDCVGVGCGADELSRLAELEPLACLERTTDLLDWLH